jgi:hypothetical protein
MLLISERNILLLKHMNSKGYAVADEVANLTESQLENYTR